MTTIKCQILSTIAMFFLSFFLSVRRDIKYIYKRSNGTEFSIGDSSESDFALSLSNKRRESSGRGRFGSGHYPNGTAKSRLLPCN